MTTIRAARIAAGYTLEALADRVGVTLGCVQRWEAGTSRPQPEPGLRLRRALPTLTLVDLYGPEFNTWPLLKRSRIEHGNSINELAIVCGVSDVTVARWEDGTRSPKPRHATLLHRVLGLSIEQIYSCAQKAA